MDDKMGSDGSSDAESEDGEDDNDDDDSSSDSDYDINEIKQNSQKDKTSTKAGFEVVPKGNI